MKLFALTVRGKLEWIKRVTISLRFNAVCYEQLALSAQFWFDYKVRTNRKILAQNVSFDFDQGEDNFYQVMKICYLMCCTLQRGCKCWSFHRFLPSLVLRDICRVHGLIKGVAIWHS